MIEGLINSNGEIRELFQKFLDGGRFEAILSQMREYGIEAAELSRGSHRVIIDGTNRHNGLDAEESEAAEKKKYFKIFVSLDGSLEKAIRAHRIVNPDGKKQGDYIIASCWVFAHDFWDDYAALRATVQDVLENACHLVACEATAELADATVGYGELCS